MIKSLFWGLFTHKWQQNLVKTKHELNCPYLSASPKSCLVNFLNQPLGLAWIKSQSVCSYSQFFNLSYYSKNRLKLFLKQLKVKQEDHLVSNCENVTDNQCKVKGKEMSLGHNPFCYKVHILRGQVLEAFPGKIKLIKYFFRQPCWMKNARGRSNRFLKQLLINSWT